MTARRILMSSVAAGLALAGSVVAQTGPANVHREGCPTGAAGVGQDAVASTVDSIEVWRKGCSGACPVYRLTVGGDGKVTWNGERMVELRGTTTDSVDGLKARDLIQEAVDHEIFGLCTRYVQGGTVATTYVTTVTIAGRRKQVEDTGDAAPAWLRTLDAEVDALTDSHRWRHGEPTRETFGRDRLLVDALWPKIGVTRLMRVVTQQDTKELASMISDTALDVNATDSSGWTALMYAAQAGQIAAMQMLLQVHADAERRSQEGQSAMFAAASAEDRPGERLRLLKAAGVDVNGLDSRGGTPLMVAAGSARFAEAVPALLELGADPAKRDASGKKAVDYLDGQDMAVQNTSAFGRVRALLVAKEGELPKNGRSQ